MNKCEHINGNKNCVVSRSWCSKWDEEDIAYIGCGTYWRERLRKKNGEIDKLKEEIQSLKQQLEEKGEEQGILDKLDKQVKKFFCFQMHRNGKGLIELNYFNNATLGRFTVQSKTVKGAIKKKLQAEGQPNPKP